MGSDSSVKGHKTRKEDKVPIWRKVGYGLGMTSFNVQGSSLMNMVTPVFNDCMGVDPRWIGLIMGGSRVWDAVTDPVMGNITDNTRTRWGRRRPWIALAAFLCAFTFVGVWAFPRGMSSSFYVGWLVISTLLFYLAFTIFSVPYFALGMELSPDYHERTSVMAFRNVTAQAGFFVVSSLFWLTSLPQFGDRAEGMRYVGMGIGALILILTLISVFAAKEHPSALEGQKKQDKVKLLTSVKETLSNQPFRILVGATVFMQIGLLMVNNLGYYVGVYYVFGGDKGMASGKMLTFMGYASQVCGLISIPILTMLSKKIGKKATILGTIALAFVGTLSKWFCFTPSNPWLMLVPPALMSLGLASCWTFIHAMIPDTVDWDELHTGQRREGMYGAIYNWAYKLGVALSLILSGFALSWTGFDADLGSDQTERTLLLMRLFFMVIPAVSVAAGFMMMIRYSLNEEQVHAVKEKLAARKAVEA